MVVKILDLLSLKTNKPGIALNLVFIHHSYGGQLMADKGDNCIFETSPNGGRLDSQPDSEVNNIITKKFIPFLNKATQRMGIN
jgi:hypothetical protein